MLKEHDQKEAWAAELEEAKRAVSHTDRTLDPRLHEYQVRAVHHLHENPRAGLFLDMGLGKTATVLQAITDEHKPILVIAPKRVAENVWEAERDKWRPDLEIAIAAGSPKKRADALFSGSEVVVLGRDNIKDLFQGTKPPAFKAIVLDELSGFKNRQSQRFKLAKNLTKPATYVWGLTGTPTPNGLLDLWSQMFLLDRGERLGKFITGYRGRYFVAGNVTWVKTRTGNMMEVVTEWNLRPGADKRIQSLISDICLSMKAEDYLDLPPVTDNVVHVPLPAKARRIYQQLEDDLVASEPEIVAKNAAIRTLKHRQLTAGFIYGDVDEGEPELTLLHEEKIKTTVEIIEGTGDNTLVFYHFKAELEMLRAALPQARMLDEPGVMDDWNAGRVPVMLAHPKSAGHGLNLQDGGHTIIWASLDWPLEDYEQSNARLARQGQKHPVMIHHLVSPGTVDEAIVERLTKKMSVQDALMNYLKG